MTAGTGSVTIALGPSSPRVDAAVAQLRHLFAGPAAAGADLHVGYGSPPPGHRVVDAWRVVPAAAAPLFLVPLDPRAARRLLSSHNGLRGARVRAARTAASLAVGGVAALAGDRTVLRASVPDDVPDDVVDVALVTRHLVRTVPGAAATAVSLRAFHPLAKPTVQVTDPRGDVVAFTKVAIDRATAARVEREATLLRRLGVGRAGTTDDRTADDRTADDRTADDRATEDRCPREGVRLPRVLDHGRVGDFTLCVVEPLPRRTRGVRAGDEAAVLGRLAAFAALGDTGRTPLRATALWRELTARAAAVTGTACTRPDIAAALAGLVEAVERSDGDRELAVGAFHGDWVPWNMGWHGADLWVWDLEYGSPQGPVGLDALRWVFQVEHVLHRRRLTDAVDAMAAAVPRVLTRLGLAAEATDLAPALVRVHLVAVASTALAALAAGRGLPPGLDPEVVDVLRAWSVR